MDRDDSTINRFLHDPTLKPGHIVDGRFRVLRLLGEGSFSRVYEAEDERLDRTVALKTVQAGADSDPVRRLERELVFLRSMQHTNIVRLFDAGRDPDGIHYLSLEIVRGPELGKVIATEAPLDLERTLHIVFQILDGLTGALAHDVVHLDLKPSNVLLTREGVRSDVVKLLDFGIAKTFEPTSGFGYADATMGAGTPLYMAPEQIQNRNIGPHTDVYAVGLIMLEMLTGTAPFTDEDVVELMSNKPRAAIEVPPDIMTVPIAAVLRRALQADHRQRFHSAAAMYMALQDAAASSHSAAASGFGIETTHSGVTALASPKTRPTVDTPQTQGAVERFFADFGKQNTSPSTPAPEPSTGNHKRRHTVAMDEDELERVSNTFSVDELEREAHEQFGEQARVSNDGAAAESDANPRNGDEVHDRLEDQPTNPFPRAPKAGVLKPRKVKRARDDDSG